MIAICDDAPASVGPEIRFEPPSSFSASSTPECSNSSYGLPSCFGIETVLSPCGISALGSTLLSSLDADVLSFEDDDWSSCVSPQAANTSAATRASAARTARRVRGVADIMTSDPPPGDGQCDGGAPR